MGRLLPADVHQGEVWVGREHPAINPADFVALERQYFYELVVLTKAGGEGGEGSIITARRQPPRPRPPAATHPALDITPLTGPDSSPPLPRKNGDSHDEEKL